MNGEKASDNTTATKLAKYNKGYGYVYFTLSIISSDSFCGFELTRLTIEKLEKSRVSFKIITRILLNNETLIVSIIKLPN